VATIDGQQRRAREGQQEIGLAQIKQMSGDSHRAGLDQWLKGRPALRFGECSGAPVPNENDSGRQAPRYAVRRLAGIERADWWQFFSHLAPSDIRYRFGRLVEVEAALRLLMLPNHYGSGIFAAFCPEGLVGVANLAKDDTGQAEIAVLVRTDSKRRGIGETLMRTALCQATRERLQVYGFVHPSNSAIINLMRRLGFASGLRQTDYTIMHWHPPERQRITGRSEQQANRNEAAHWPRSENSSGERRPSGAAGARAL